jgi:hypothetical protein
LEVTERLEVNGSISGRNLDDFLANPNLLQTTDVKSACQFRDLIVDGPIIIENTFNGLNLAKVLDSVVYNDEEAVIDSVKTFQNVEFVDRLNVSSNLINDFNMDNFMIADEEQKIDLKTLQGDLIFTNLEVGGFFDGINVTDLEFNAVRTFGDQFTGAQLIFPDPDNFLVAAQVQIKNTFNFVPVQDFLDAKNVLINGDPIFETLKIENLELSGDVVGPGKLINFDIVDFKQTRFSKSLEQTIITPFKIKSLKSEGNFNTKFINERNMSVFKSYVRQIKSFDGKLMIGKSIQDFIVNGSVTVYSLNNRNFQDIMENAIWLDRHNNISATLNFVDELVVEKNLQVFGFVNNKNFDQFTNDLVKKTDAIVDLSSSKMFQTLKVASVETESINGIAFDQILVQDDEISVGFFNFAKGKLMVNKLSVLENFNGLSTQELGNIYSYDSTTQTYNIKQDIIFDELVSIKTLDTPLLNSNNITKFFSNLILKTEDNIKVMGSKIFLNSVNFSRGLFIKQFNGLNLGFLPNVVLRAENVPVVINGDIVFEGPVKTPLVVIANNLISRFVSGCDTAEWRSNGLMVNQDNLIIGKFLVFLLNFLINFQFFTTSR